MSPNTCQIKSSAPRYRRFLVGIALLGALLGGPTPGHAAVGSVLFSDDFESGFGKWTTTDSNLSGINAFTANSPNNSLFVRGDTVTTTSIAIDTAVPAIRVEGWIQRGSNDFSDEPEKDDDLLLEYLNDSGGWVLLQRYPGKGKKAEVFTLSIQLAGDALHPLFRIRATLTSGKGGPPSNKGIGRSYWHIDDIRVVEPAPSMGLVLGGCEDFEGSLARWSVSGSGIGRVTTQTANSPAYSLAMYGEAVSITSAAIDLTLASQLVLRPWIRRGDKDFSDKPGKDDDLVVEYLNDSGSWVLLQQFPGKGQEGEIFQPQYPLPVDAAHANFQIRLRKLDGKDDKDYWHVDDVCLDGTALRAEWRFEDGTWNGSTGELQDSSGNGFAGSALGTPQPGIANPALGTDPGTCAYADLDGLGDSFEIPHSPGLSGSGTLSYTAWVYSRDWSGTRQVMAKSVHGGGSGRAQMGIFSEGGLLKGRAETVAGRVELTTTLPPTNQWSHIALTFSGTSLSLYVNGLQVASTTIAQTALVTNSDPLAIGKRVGTTQYFFDGYIDEARVYGSWLDAATVQQIATEIHDCPNSATEFRIVHDGTGFHCQAESITVRAVDLVGNVLTGFTGTITLDTQASAGTWSLTSGSGSFSDATPDDGRADYTYVSADTGTATFALAYTSGPPSIDVDAFMGSFRDDDSEGPLVFSPTGFTLTGNALANPPPSPINDPVATQVAGRSFPLHITAYGTNPSSGSCGVIESYDGDRGVRFWIDHVDPASGLLVPTVDLNSIAVSEASAVDQTVRFSQGQAEVSVKYKDVGRISLGVADYANAPGMTLRGTSNSFVSQPADFAFTAITTPAPTLTPNLGGDTPTGPLFARAGEAFRVQIEARDFEGSLTPSYGRESSPEGVRIASSTLLAPAGGRNGTTDTGLIQNATDFTATAVPGQFEGSAFSFDEVGAIQLQASVADADYLGSGAVVGSPSGTVGRFAPSRFEVVANNPRFDTTCPTGAFSWMGQPFFFVPGLAPVLTVTAVGAAGVTTRNYSGAWWRLTNASLAGRSYTAAVALDESGLPDPAADPAIAIGGDGTGTLTFSAGTGLRVTRAAPIPPFDLEVEIALDVLDEDATAFASNPFTLGGTTPAAGVAFDVSKRFQYGRLRIDNAFGSELVDLAMNLRVQRFDGGAFTDDLNDSCSVIPVSSLSLTPSPGSLSTAPQINNAPLLSGNAGLVLGAPNAQGEVSLIVDLGPGGANLPWLRFDWPEDGNLDGLNDDDPRAKAVFGIWSGRDTKIYVREQY